MSDEKFQTMGLRLAFRKEGAFVNCYSAQLGTMADATLIGSMRVSVLNSQPGLWDEWKALMKGVYSAAIEDSIGVTPEWGGEEKAPEHERAGEA